MVFPELSVFSMDFVPCGDLRHVKWVLHCGCVEKSSEFTGEVMETLARLSGHFGADKMFRSGGSQKGLVEMRFGQRE